MPGKVTYDPLLFSLSTITALVAAADCAPATTRWTASDPALPRPGARGSMQLSADGRQLRQHQDQGGSPGSVLADGPALGCVLVGGQHSWAARAAGVAACTL